MCVHMYKLKEEVDMYQKEKKKKKVSLNLQIWEPKATKSRLV